MSGKLVLRFKDMWNADNPGVVYGDYEPGTVEYSEAETVIFRKQGGTIIVEFTELEWEQITEFIQKEMEKDGSNNKDDDA